MTKISNPVIFKMVAKKIVSNVSIRGNGIITEPLYIHLYRNPTFGKQKTFYQHPVLTSSSSTTKYAQVENLIF